MAGSRTFKASRPYKAHLQRGSGGVQAEVRDLRLDIDSAFMALETSGQLALYHLDTVPPTVTDDSSLGFAPFSKWIDTAAAREYTCISSGIGAAVWSETTNLGVVPGGIVASVFGRVGIVTSAPGDYLASQVTNDSGVAGAFVSDALDTLASAIPPAAPVSSVFGRVGAVAAAASDYNASQVDNDSGVAGAFVSNALDALDAAKVPTGRVITAGGGLAGGGDLSANRTFDVVSLDASILVAPGGIQVGVISNAQHGNRSGGGLHSDATPVSSGFMSTSDKAKLNGISAGAQVNMVNTVFGRVGAVVPVAGDYAASGVTNDSGVAGAFVSGALDALNSGKIGTARAITAGAGLTGGGDLSADRTFDVVANADGSIVANADDVQVGVLATDAQHGVRGGGTQHALVDGASAGFMSTADKIKLDAIGGGATSVWQEVVLDKDLTAPPGGPAPNDRYIVAAPATGAWVGREDDIAQWDGASWTFLTPTEGFTAWIADEDIWYSYNGAWGIVSSDALHGVRSGGTLHALVVAGAPGTAGFISGVSQAKLDGIAASAAALTATPPVDVTKAAAAVGAGITAARHDHKHDVSTTAPGATGVGTASGEGVATTLARSDHSHQSNTAPTNITKAAAVIGTSGEPARADHKHDANTAAAVELTDATNAEGAATSLARSNHTHAHGNRGGGTLHANVIAAGAAGFMTGADKTILNNKGKAAQARRTTAYVLTTAFVDITLDTTDVESDAAVLDHDLVTNTDRILIGVTGLYRLYFRVQGSLDFNNQVQGRIRVNDTTVIPGSLSSIGGNSHNNEHPYELSKVVYASLTSGDFISLQLQGTPAVGTSTANANIMFSAEKL